MELSGIEVGRYHYLKSLGQQTPCKLHAESVALVGRHLSGREGLDEVEPLYAILFVEMSLCVHHLTVSCTLATTDGALVYCFLCLVPVQGIAHGIGEYSLFLVHCLIDGATDIKTNRVYPSPSHISISPRSVSMYDRVCYGTP